MDTVLYFAATRGAVASAEEALGAVGRRVSPLRFRQIRLACETSSARTVAKLRSMAADAVVLDARAEEGGLDDSACLSVLKALFEEHAFGSPIGRERVSLVVPGDARGAALAFEAGKLRLGRIVVDPGDGAWEAVWETIVAGASSGRGGKVAICLAGGGTEGLFYEFGVLRALDRFLPNWDVTKADVICGISAGAVVGALLANGIGPEEFARALQGQASRIDPIKRTDLFDPDLGTLASRAVTLAWETARGRRSPLSALFRLVPPGVFAGRRLERWLEHQFNKPGMIDRFEDLPRKLFVGATDQDSNEHVVFGSPGAPKVRIHEAVRASTALAPFYAPKKLHGRYYVDGGFTRTTNMRVAVQAGATLVILIDPLVPVASLRPGHVAERGGIFVAMQGLKSLINGRFDKAVPTLRAMYPHVAFHLFQPGDAARRVMGGSPMKYFYRQEIEEIAFRETVREIRGVRARSLARDFARHGIELVDPDEGRVDAREEPDFARVVA